MDKAINYNNINNQINLLLLVVTITIGFYCWILSYGFTDHSPLTIIKAISFTSILLFLPDFIFFLLNKISSPNKYQWFRSIPFITLLVIIMLLLLSVLQSVWSLKLYSYLLYFGLFLILAFIIRYLVYYFKFIDIIYSVFAILFAFFLGSIVWGAGYTSPLIVEQLGTIQLKEIDTLYHAAVTGMIKTYNIPSTGLNGIPFLPYHWGSHWIIAQFSYLVNVSALQFYNICFPIIFCI